VRNKEFKDRSRARGVDGDRTQDAEFFQFTVTWTQHEEDLPTEVVDN